MILVFWVFFFLRQRPLGTAETAHQPSSGLSPGRSRNTSAVIRERRGEGIGYVGCTGDSWPLLGEKGRVHARRAAHASAPPAHTWNQSADTKARAGLKQNAEALNGWSVYSEKKGGLSRCQIWNTLMSTLCTLSDETWGSCVIRSRWFAGYVQIFWQRPDRHQICKMPPKRKKRKAASRLYAECIYEAPFHCVPCNSICCRLLENQF